MATYPDLANILPPRNLRPAQLGTVEASTTPPRLEAFFFKAAQTLYSDTVYPRFAHDAFSKGVSAYSSGKDYPDEVIAIPYQNPDPSAWSTDTGPAVGTEIRANTGAVYTVTQTTVVAGKGAVTATWKAWR